MLLFAGISGAQQAAQIIKFKVPFEFNVGRQAFPAGKYSIAIDAAHFLALRDSQGRVLTKVLTNRVDATGQAGSTRLEFLSNGDQHVLTAVWRQDQSRGYELPQSRQRTLLARSQAARTRPVLAGTQP